MSTNANQANQLDRLPSGIPGLDKILQGGFPRAGISIIQGMPGAGKTILGNQLCYSHVANGGKAIYVTLLAESHSRMMLHMSQLDFHDASVIPERLYLISAFRVLEESGLKGLQDLLRREVQRHRATVLVLDGLVAAEESASSTREFKKFIHELQTQATLTDCTMFLLTSVSPRTVSPEHTMVDGVIELRSEFYGRSSERALVVHKMRGVGMLRGLHAMRISRKGMEVFPRIEALVNDLEHQQPGVRAMRSTGRQQLDEMAGGGLPEGSTTLLVGSVGVGKTTLGMHFLGESTVEEPGVMLGFYELPEALVAKSRALKLAFEQQVESGVVELIWQPTTEGQLDEVCARLLSTVTRMGAKRVFIDGVGGMGRLSGEPDRLGRVLAALNIFFQANGVTAIYTAESDLSAGIHGKPFDGLSLQGVSSVAQNIVLMRYVELRSQLYRMLSVLKIRNAAIDSDLRLFRMSAGGIDIDTSPEAAENVLREHEGLDAGRRSSSRSGV